MNDAPPPLDGIRVVDLSRVLAGPYCTALLADLGAEVIKIEPPHGDDARHLGPFRNGESLYFDALNRRKTSVALDLKQAPDREHLLGLLDNADVLVENFRPGVTGRLGIDYETVAANNPRLVYASISGFGQEGPMGQAAAYDLVVQALSGIMSTTGNPDGPPTRIGESFGDLAAGLFGAWGITAALLERHRSGRGQHLDVAMFDSLLSLQVTGHALLQATGTSPGRVGNRHPVSTPFDTFAADDGPVVIAVASHPGFVRLMRAIGREDLVDDERFADDTQRTRHEPALKTVIETWTGSRTVKEVVDTLAQAGLAASPVWDLEQAVNSEQTISRDLVRSFEHPQAGLVQFIRQPVRYSRSGEPPVRRSPLLNEQGVGVDPSTRP